MNAAISELPSRRLHVPKKVLGDNFYPMMYGQYRTQRVQAMALARLRKGEARAYAVREARKMNREAVWYLRRIEVCK